jgi:hypothetical protein
MTSAADGAGGAGLYQSFFVPTIAAPVSHELLAVANPVSGDRVVDVACGTGVVARAVAERDVIAAWSEQTPDPQRLEQPMALAWGYRTSRLD